MQPMKPHILDAKWKLDQWPAAKMEATLGCVRHIGTTLRCIGKQKLLKIGCIDTHILISKIMNRYSMRLRALLEIRQRSSLL